MQREDFLADPIGFRAAIARRVARLIDAGPTLSLVGYDANGIQRFVTRATPLPYMRGGSALVVAFDKAQSARGDCLFAAGGRGRFLVPCAPDDPRLTERMAAMRKHFGEVTGGEVLAVAAVPFDARHQARSMARLARELDITKDEALPPDHTAIGERSGEPQCEVCHRRPIEHDSTRGQPLSWKPAGRRSVPLCGACAAIFHQGYREAEGGAEHGKTLSDISSTNRLAILSADGNGMGQLFRSLGTLADAAVASDAVDALFRTALIRALDKADVPPAARVTPVVGGDDIRLFTGPERIFEVVEGLVTELEQGIAALAPTLGFPAEVVEQFSQIGIGAGLVIGPATHPASLAIGHAHLLEASAKRLCADGPWRSAIDFIHLRTGDELIGASSPARHPLGLSRKDGGEPEAGSWQSALKGARSLVAMPSSQRNLILRTLREARRVGQGDSASDPIFENTLRYQIARSKAWQGWYDSSDVDWTDGRAVVEHAPSHGMLEMARILDLVERATRPEGKVGS